MSARDFEELLSTAPTHREAAEAFIAIKYGGRTKTAAELAPPPEQVEPNTEVEDDPLATDREKMRTRRLMAAGAAGGGAFGGAVGGAHLGSHLTKHLPIPMQVLAATGGALAGGGLGATPALLAMREQSQGLQKSDPTSMVEKEMSSLQDQGYAPDRDVARRRAYLNYMRPSEKDYASSLAEGELSPEQLSRFRHIRGMSLSPEQKMTAYRPDFELPQSLKHAMARSFEELTHPVHQMSAKVASVRKLAFEGDPEEWMQQEEMLQQVQDQAELEDARAAKEEAQTVLQERDMQLQQMTQQMQELQMQADQATQQSQMAIQQGQVLQNAAAQSAQAANQAAVASTLKAMQSASEVLRHKMLTANMQQNVEGWKQQLADIAMADPAAEAGAQVGMPMSGDAGANMMAAAQDQQAQQEAAMMPPEGAPMEGAPPEAAPAAPPPEAMPKQGSVRKEGSAHPLAWGR